MTYKKQTLKEYEFTQPTQAKTPQQKNLRIYSKGKKNLLETATWPQILQRAKLDESLWINRGSGFSSSPGNTLY